MKISTLPALVGLLICTVGFAAAAAGKLSFTSTPSLLLTEDITQTPMAPITIVRTEGSEGRVTAQVRADAVPTCPVSEHYPVLRYRLQATDAWINLPWEGSIPVTFADGQTEFSFQIGAVDNDAWEGIQPLTGTGGLFGILRLENISSPAAAGSVVSRMIRVSGDDPPPVMTVVPLYVQEGNGGGLRTRFLRVNLDRPIARAVISCELTVVTGGTATSGADFTLPWAAPNSSVLPAYVQSFDVPIHVVADSDIESDETILCTVSLRALTAGPGSDTLTLESAATITILNDEFPPISIGVATLEEGQAGIASLVFPVRLAAALTADVSFNWSTVSGTAPGQATEGSDFVAASGTVTIPAGQTQAAITITVNGDTIPEEDESLMLSLTAPVGVALPEGNTSGLIVDDDRPRILIGSPRVVEGNVANTPMVFPVTLTIAQQVPVTFDYAFVQGLGNDVALQGNDYIATNGTVTIPPGSTTAFFSATIIGDSLIEADESVAVVLSNASGAVLPTGPVVGWIETDDFPMLGVPHVWNLGETDTSYIHNIAFMMTGPTTAGASVDWSIDAPPGSLSPTSGTLFLRFGITTMNFTVLGDDVPESDVTINITFSNPVGFLLPPGGPTYPLISLGDDDRRTISVTGGTVAEGNSGTATLPFTVSLSSALQQDFTFNYATSGGTAIAGQDYIAASGSATISAGQTSTTIDVIVTGDAQIELDETVGFAISEFSLPTDAGPVIPGVIMTEDFPPGPAPQGTMVTEASGNGTVQAWFAVELSAARSVPFTCRVSTRSGTAIAGSDFNALAPTDITFAAGETSKWVAITVTASPEAEPVEQFILDVEALDSHEIKSAACTIERLAVTDFWQPSPGIYAIRFPTGLGQRYIVEESTSLAGPWTPVSSILTGSGFPVTQLLFSAAESAFFHVRVAPPLPPGTAAAGS